MNRTTENETKDPYRLKLHLTPPTGWLNDPNGLCQYNGTYHAFYQYVPENALGKGRKCWGHAVSSDLIHWKDEGIFLEPDRPFDRDGVYSGCALTDENGIHLFYTGNVKEEGDYDYIYEGRQAAQVLVETKDGSRAGEKRLLLTNDDYPKDCTLHVRDPKVWKENGRYHMVLGARKNSDQGAVLLYDSADMVTWEYVGEMTTKNPFGYMWECPDCFEMEDAAFLSICPQGLPRGEFQNQNVYQSGYVRLKEGIAKPQIVEAEAFTEWDKGFDFYAPQTFTDEQGRRILIGWMGLPDIEGEYSNPTVGDGWQHALTLPREITYEAGRLCQRPVEELKRLRRNERVVKTGETSVLSEGIYEVEIDKIEINQKDINQKDINGMEPASCHICFNQDLVLDYQDGVFSMNFLNRTGAGRTVRRAEINSLEDIRIIMDTSAIEVYVNQGSTVFTSRYYPASGESRVVIDCEKSRIRLWDLESV